MENKKIKRTFRTVLIWAGWAIFAQVLLANISAALYAYKLTHLYNASPSEVPEHYSRNIFTKTFRLFTGPRLYRREFIRTPSFEYDTVLIKTTNDVTLEGWYARPDSNAKGTVILFHALMGNKTEVLDEATEFRNWGYNVLLVDARSHGRSGGRTTTIGHNEADDVRSAYDEIVRRGEKNIFLWGTSMGAVSIVGAVAKYNLNPSGVIIEMPFFSLQSHLRARARILGFPSQPFAFLVTFWIGAERGFNGYRFKTANYARKVTCPVLEQYGSRDNVVLKRETDAIYNALPPGKKRLVNYEEGQHESFLRRDPATWRREVEQFLNECGHVTF
jgi:alpha-beta hydrolase superfamily lysophospholipase